MKVFFLYIKKEKKQKREKHNWMSSYLASMDVVISFLDQKPSLLEEESASNGFLSL